MRRVGTIGVPPYSLKGVADSDHVVRHLRRAGQHRSLRSFHGQCERLAGATHTSEDTRKLRKCACGCVWGRHRTYIGHQHCPIIRRVNAPHHESHDLNRLSPLANALLYSRMCMHELRIPGKTRKGRVMHSVNTQTLGRHVPSSSLPRPTRAPDESTAGWECHTRTHTCSIKKKVKLAQRCWPRAYSASQGFLAFQA